MATLLEYFNNDFKDLSIDADLPVQLKSLVTGQTETVLTIKRRVKHDINSSVRLITFYIPEHNGTFSIIASLLSDLASHIKSSDGVQTIASFNNDIQLGVHKSLYSNRVYIYAETSLGENQLAQLNELCKQKQIYLTLRGDNYLKEKLKAETPLAFISHDSRDKEFIAKPISHGLNSRLCFTWYDEYSLKVGQSLRESIEKGIKEAKKCVLILTPNFINNPGWTKKEFNSIFTREMLFEEKIVLPIWYNVTAKDVYEYSPSLADTYALLWPEPKTLSQEEYKRETQVIISKLHTEITR